MKRAFAVISLIIGMLVVLSACGIKDSASESNKNEAEESSRQVTQDAKQDAGSESVDGVSETENVHLSLSINGTPISVKWEDSESVDALRDLAKDKPLTIGMSPYGSFEQVGSLGSTLPSNDVQMTTEPGDIVLYSSNQIVLFYGSNSWAYTRLGKITDKTVEELTELLGKENVDITLEMK